MSYYTQIVDGRVYEGDTIYVNILDGETRSLIFTIDENPIDGGLNEINVNANNPDAQIRIFHDSRYLPHFDYKGFSMNTANYHIKDGKYLITITAPGCKPYTETIDIQGGKKTERDIVMEAAGEGEATSLYVTYTGSLINDNIICWKTNNL